MPTEHNANFPDTSYVPILITLGVPLLAWALSELGLEQSVVGAVSTGCGGLALNYRLRRQQRRMSKTDNLREFLWGDTNQHPLTVALLVALLLAFFEFATGAIVGFIVATYHATIVANQDVSSDGLLAVLSLVSLPTLFLFSVLLSRFACHRIHNRQIRWVGFALILSRLISSILFFVFVDPGVYNLPAGSILIGQLIVLVVMSLGAWLGIFWARRTSSAYRISLLFSRLPPEDGQAVIDLLREHLSDSSSAHREAST